MRIRFIDLAIPTCVDFPLEIWNELASHCSLLKMTYKPKRIAVIGAGVSGVTTAKHLKASGIDVVVYERSSGCGGVWYVYNTFESMGDRC